MEKRLFTSESVTEGHPDKICDQISDAVLDALYEQDPYSRVACETLTNTGFVVVMGEVTTKANVDIPKIVRDTVVEIGYDSSEKGFDGNTCAVMVALDKQSTDIAMGVDKALEAKTGKDDDAAIEAIAAALAKVVNANTENTGVKATVSANVITLENVINEDFNVVSELCTVDTIQEFAPAILDEVYVKDLA